MKSIMQDEKKCYICGSRYWLHRHHIYGGNKNRDNSEKYGFTVWLCEPHHTGPYGVHGEMSDKFFSEKLMRECQAKFEETHSHEEFMKIIGKNYL